MAPSRGRTPVLGAGDIGGELIPKAVGSRRLRPEELAASARRAAFPNAIHTAVDRPRELTAGA